MFVSKEQIETLIATKIKDLSLYQRAFTHKSPSKSMNNLQNPLRP